MKLPLLILLLLVTGTPKLAAQDTPGTGWQQQLSLLSVQGDFVFAFLNYEKGAITPSLSVAADIDFMNYGHSGKASSLLGGRVGYTGFLWPDIEESEKYVNSHGYRANDYDFLARYTYLSGALRTDILAGLTIRDGRYWIDYVDRGLESNKSRELRLSPGLKLGGALTIMLIKPVLALRFKASCFFGGYYPIEGGAFGLALVLGWQRED
ncbi:MAG: hypothetical protein IH600_09350 [Bacteroidetes bacterium]|nr:hypothetical protein [Bacteroidota bacterium]